jgi:sterol desaturase/sphingolipid hydroxylase (fatty acid hydroxylase superfamily)
MSVEVIPNNKGTKKLFDNKILEKLTRTHIAIPISIFIIYSGALLYYSIAVVGTLTALQTTGLFVTGFLVFTLVEYTMHRFLFHIGTKTKKREKFQYTLHGVHHEFPKDKERLAMPPIMSITIATTLLFVIKLLLNIKVFAFLPGFLVGYAGYLFMHYILHTYKAPKGMFNFLWANHAVHHYKDQTKAYGVTNPIWDMIFGTMPDNKK